MRPRKAGDRAWSTVYSGYGVRLGVSADDPGLADSIREHIPPGLRPAGTPGGEDPELWFALETRALKRSRKATLRCGKHVVAETRDTAELLRRMESEIQIAVGVRAPHHLFVHAGVVVWENEAIVIPGTSHSGKTELVLELVRAGAAYGSDEYAVLNSSGLVLPFARRLSRRTDDGRRERLTARDLGGSPFREPHPVGTLLVTEFRRGVRWKPEPLTAAEGLLTLLANAVGVRDRPEFALRALRRALESTTCLQSDRGEAGPTARRILASHSSAAA